MINLIKKDLRVAFSNKVTNIMLLLFFPFILFFGEFEDSNIIFIFSTFIFVFSLSKVTFVFEVRDKAHLFIQSLPVTKRDMVVSKYISIFLYFAMGVIYTFIYMRIFNLFGLVDMTKIPLSIILLSLGYAMFALSITLPMQFRFPVKVANLINLILFMIFIIFITFTEGDLYKIFNLDFNNIFIKLGIVAVIAVVYFISMGISICLYKSRKFY